MQKNEQAGKTGRLSFKLIAVALSLIVTFAVLEVCARIYLLNFANESIFKKYASVSQLQKKYNNQIYSPHRYLGFYPTPDYQKDENKHNSAGYRGDEIKQPKAADNFRIVCLGGSTTYSTSVQDYHNAYPALLEKELTDRGYDNVEVINGGVSNYSSWETLINFEFRILDLEPDMVIFYHGINDVHPRLVWPPQAYKGDNSGRRVPNNTNYSYPWILESSTMMRFVMVKLGYPRALTVFTSTIDKDADTYYGLEFMEQKKKGTYPDKIFKQVTAEKMLQTNKPVYFRRNVENLIAIAKFRNIKVILATFAFSPDFENKPRASSSEYINAINETNDVLRNIASTTNVPLFDFANIFPSGKDYFVDGRHVNVKGAQLKAKLFADFIIENNLISQPDKK